MAGFDSLGRRGDASRRSRLGVERSCEHGVGLAAEGIQAGGQVGIVGDDLIGPAAQVGRQGGGVGDGRYPVFAHPALGGLGFVVDDALAFDDEVEAVGEPDDEVGLVAAPRAVELVGQRPAEAEVARPCFDGGMRVEPLGGSQLKLGMARCVRQLAPLRLGDVAQRGGELDRRCVGKRRACEHSNLPRGGGSARLPRRARRR